MNSKNKTVAQKKWHNWLRNQGCCHCGRPDPALHHCVGSTGKHNKVHIGEWFVIPLCYDCHQSDKGIHHGMQAFHGLTDRKHIEKTKFAALKVKYFSIYGKPAVPEDVAYAIADYHR